MTAEPALLEVRDLNVEFASPDGTPLRAVRDVSFALRRGETLAVVGESGSGKSTTALALTRMLPGTGRITSGEVRLKGQELTTADEETLRSVRGTRIGMVFQDPMTALNPVLTVGRQLDEVLRAHSTRSRRRRSDRRARAAELLRLVGIPEPERRLDDHPHQFSGGQRQRVLIALALAGEPDVLVADEPTTALDATVQEQILTLLADLGRTTGIALLLITHNMGVVARSCDRVLVLYGGTVVEEGPTRDVLTRPRHPYTAGLLAAVPRLSSPSGTRLTGIPGSPPDLALLAADGHAGCAFAARCAVVEERCAGKTPPLTPAGEGRVACWPAAEGTYAPRSVTVPERIERAAPGDVLLAADDVRKTYRRGRRSFTALDGVSLTLRAGETLGIVGESGSGKSTLARVLAHAHPAGSGILRLRGRDVTRPPRAELHALRREVQFVFQDPYASLNPRLTVGEIVAEPLVAFRLAASRQERDRRVAEILEQVGLDPAAAGRLPRSFSGGQRQRIGIARALAPRPAVLICDEPVSALDVSVQAQIVNLLTDLQRDLGLALVFIAHDLAVVRQVSHRIAVMRDGRIVESADADTLCASPTDPYTRALLAAAPDPAQLTAV